LPIFDTTSGEPVELGEGRGDLRYSSMPFELWDGGPFFEGRPVSYAKVFATQPWVAIAVMRLLTWAIRVPLKVYRREDDDGARTRLRPGDHPLAAAVASPWERGSMAHLIMALLGPLCVHGNGLTDVHEGARGALRFEEVDWRTVVPIRFDNEDPNAEILGWKVHEPKATHERSADTVMHLSWWSPLGKLGISPLQQLRSTVTADAAAVDWTINNLKQAARPHGVVQMTEEALDLDGAKRRELYETSVRDLRAAYGGEQNAGKLPVMPPGFEWKTANHTTAVEAALIEQRAVHRNEAAAMYMLPPPTIGQLERATFNNIVELRQMAYTDGLAPPLVLIEQTINAHVVHGLLREDDVFVEFDMGLILRGDRLKEIRALREGINSAIYKPNEARKALNLPESDAPGADQLYLPTNNLAPLGGEKETENAQA
jgi:HK97 family phage portal protein